MPAIDVTRCIRCRRCVTVCAPCALSADTAGAIAVQEARCNHCGQCTAICPAEAISLNGIAPAALKPVVSAPLNDVQRDMLFTARRSVRQFKPEPVAPELLERALELAAYAPTARNARDVHWSVFNGREKLLPMTLEAAETLEASGAKPYAGRAALVRAGNDVVLRGAPCLIVAHAIPWRWAEADCSAALSYLELALHSLGLGTCWAGMLVNACRIQPLASLPLPEDHEAFAALMVGYPNVAYLRVPARTHASLHWY